MRYLVVGPRGAGKTTLIRALVGCGGKAAKTQMIECTGAALDTPGEYLELPRFYRALLVTAQQADVVLWVTAAAGPHFRPPPGFASSFCRPVLGVITKTDVPGASLKAASEELALAGVEEPYFTVSALTGYGLAALAANLESFRAGPGKAHGGGEEHRGKDGGSG
ncbi:MAG: ethanolamine utilization protein EutP [Firmicutes bacterium]|nr:ethanolamine utilization protein EutP [Bacillota bacterium]